MIVYNGKSRIIKRIVETVNGLEEKSAVAALNLHDSNTEISNLSDIPINTFGHILLAQSVSPFTDYSGSMNVHHICFARSDTNYRTLIVQRLSDGEMYSNSRNGWSWSGWKKLT